MALSARIWRLLRGVRRWAIGARPVTVADDVVPPTGEPVERRLQRIADQCLHGDVAGAELELHGWLREEDCPATAVTLLAALLARRGAADAALQVLRHSRRLDVDRDLALAQLHAAVLTEQGLTDAARRLAMHVHYDHGQDPLVLEWLEAFEATNLPQFARSSVDRLAVELAARPDVIPSLVAATRIKPIDRDVQMLRDALARAAREFTDQPSAIMVCQALAELALLVGDADEARRWAHRGLKLSPYNATLALVLAQVQDDAAVGPPAADVLRTVSEAHPQYPDVQAALIRRERDDGRIDRARLRLAHWLDREPNHPIARQLASELDQPREKAA